MIIIEDGSNLFNEKEKLYLENKCENFSISQLPNNKGNYYVRSYLDKNTEDSKNIINKINLNLKKHFNNFDETPSNIWINKVDSTTNKNDTFHNDKSYLTFLFYLNDDFSGGEYEYTIPKERIKKIQPKKYMSIITDSDVSHRVLPVRNGVRYSLVAFYDVKREIKTLI